MPGLDDDPPTAAILVIGNEVLAGKVDDSNVAPLARALRGLGILLRRVVIVPDEVEVIARDVRELAASHTWLFTSGGIGPTHDDVTVEAVASAFSVPIVSSPQMSKMLEDHYRERITESHLRMARMPEGATLEASDEVRWPTIRFRNAWLMPGIPEVFRMKIPVIASRLGKGRPFYSRAVFVQMDEGDVKPLLDKVVSLHPEVEVGSYPKWMDPTYRTKLTFDGRDAGRVDAARDAFVAALPPGEPQRSE